MQIRVVTDQPWEVSTDVLVVPVVGELEFTGAYDELDRRSGGELRALQAFGELRDRRYGTALGASGELPARRLLVVSAGHAEDLDRETVRKFAARAIRRLINRDVKAMAVWLDPLAESLGGDVALVADVVARGVVEGGFEPKTIYREDSDAAPPVLDELVLIAPGGDRELRWPRPPSADGSSARAPTSPAACRTARPTTSRPRCWLMRRVSSPKPMGSRSTSSTRSAPPSWAWACSSPSGRGAPTSRGCRDAVGRRGREGRPGPALAIVGKGVCFDSGGISIKPGDRMEEMKMDKTGACTVIAAIATVARTVAGLPLLAVAPAVENMPGGGATRPGDIVKAMNGKWVDIINTDAEGRLILGDAMTYAEQLGATHIVDVATLTGAVGRAFGNIVTGAFATPDPWWDQLTAAADRAGERYWRIPLIKDYMSEMESWYADIQNTGTPDGSLVKSGLFLEQFRTVPWAHLDIGGTGYFRKTYPYAPRGATGVTHATLVELALAGAAGA